jgi:serine/threonine protein kinase
MMDFLDSILLSVAGGVATGVGQHLYDRLKNYLNDLFKDKREHNIIKALEEIGNLADGDIRRRVEEFARLRKLPAGQAEELTALLINPVADNGMPGWRLTRFLGMGSFGEVWQAESAEYPEPRAVKLFTSADAVEWIRAEQKTLFKVRAELPKHPNLIGFLDVALTGKPFPYLVLEYASGGSLEEWILRHEKDRPALDKQEVMAGIIRGLVEAHEHEISHRDLKPANILLSGEDDPVPKIADFGLARVNTRHADASAQTSQAAVVGTTMYLPPEALQQFTKRSPLQDDVFAVGVIWYQLLVGKLERPPYDFADRLREHLVDLQTIRVIERCLAHPARRYKDGSDLGQAVEAMDSVPVWPVPQDCFDVQHLGRAYLMSKV